MNKLDKMSYAEFILHLKFKEIEYTETNGKNNVHQVHYMPLYTWKIRTFNRETGEQINK
jgi:hypothetical protein